MNDHDDDVETDELPPPLSSRIEHLSRKWTEEDEDRKPTRPHRRTRRRIEDWREARSLTRDFEDELDL